MNAAIGDVPLSLINLDARTQARALPFDPEVVEEYADRMRKGEEFPPVELYQEGETYWPGDGHHRIRAAVALALPTLHARVQPGTARDALLHSIRSNHAHGLRRTRADKHRAIEALLLDPEWQAWSDSAIAKTCGVDPHTVKARRSILGTSKDPVRTCERNGRVYRQDTSGIGKTPMLSALRFVQGGARRDNPGCVRMGDGRVTAGGRDIVASAPFPSALVCRPKAAALLEAVAACGEAAQLTLRENGYLIVTSELMRAPPVPCQPESMPQHQLEGEPVELGPGLLSLLRELEPWALPNGVLLRGSTAFAGSVCRTLDAPVFAFAVNLYADAVGELLRINEEPVAARVGASGLTFMFSGERWLRVQLRSDHSWAKDTPAGLATPVPEGLFGAVRRLTSVGADGVSLEDGAVRTPDGAEAPVPGLRGRAFVSARALLAVEKRARTLDVTSDGDCVFSDGAGLRGRIARAWRTPKHSQSPTVHATPTLREAVPPWHATPALDELCKRFGLVRVETGQALVGEEAAAKLVAAMASPKHP